MFSDAGTGLARADQSIAEAEHNIRQLGTLLPHLASTGYPTVEVEGQLELMARMLDALKTRRWEIEGMLGEP
jgi:hypothetical protein